MKMLVANMPELDYFAAKAASNSVLGRMKRSPAHCREYMDNHPEPTTNMKLGSLVHTLTLEPDEFNARYYVSDEGDPSAPRKSSVVEIINALNDDKFDELFMIDSGNTPKKPRSEKSKEIFDALDSDDDIKKFVVEPAMNKKTKEGKEQYAEFKRKCERESLIVVKQDDIEIASEYYNHIVMMNGRSLASESDLLVAKNYYEYTQLVGSKIIIDQDLLDKALAMVNQLFAHPTASKLLSNGTAEQSLFWKDEDTGYKCKARIDFESNMGYLVDLKTSRDASKAEFSRSIAKFGYHRQNAMYRDGYIAVTDKIPKGFIFVVVESDPPYPVGVYSLDPDGVEKGQDEYKELLAEFAQCQKNDNWPAYSDQVETIELPGWYS